MPHANRLQPIVYYGSIFIYNIYFHPLSKYPGPRIAAATDWPTTKSYFGGDGPMHYLQLHNQYGPVVRTSPNELSFINASQWKEIYGHRPAGQREFEKDEKYHAGLKREPTILNSNQEYHRYIRRLLAHGFSDKSLREQETVLQECINTLFQKLHDEGEGGKVAVNLVSWYTVSSGQASHPRQMFHTYTRH